MSHKTTLDLTQHRDALLALLRDIIDHPLLSKADLEKMMRASARQYHTKVFSRDELIRAYRDFADSGALPPADPAVLGVCA